MTSVQVKKALGELVAKAKGGAQLTDEEVQQLTWLTAACENPVPAAGKSALAHHVVTEHIALQRQQLLENCMSARACSRGSRRWTSSGGSCRTTVRDLAGDRLEHRGGTGVQGGQLMLRRLLGAALQLFGGAALRLVR